MALVKPQTKNPAKGLKKVGNKGLAMDVQIGAGMASMVLLSQQGIQGMAQVLKGANDPVQALAHVIFLAISKTRTALQQRKLPLDDRVWIMGGGVLDRVIFETMMVLATVVKYPQAQNSQFVAAVKSAVLDLMEDSDQNDKAIKVLHDRGLPVPKGPPSASGQGQQGQQGLAAPQPQQGLQQPPQAPQGAANQPMMGGQ